MIDSTCAIKVQMLNILDNKSYNSTICEPFLCRQISVQIFVEFASIGNLLSVASNSGLRRPIKLADPQFFINIYDILKYIKLADSQTYFTKKCWNRRYSAIHPSRLPIVKLILSITDNNDTGIANFTDGTEVSEKYCSTNNTGWYL